MWKNEEKVERNIDWDDMWKMKRGGRKKDWLRKWRGEFGSKSVAMWIPRKQLRCLTKLNRPLTFLPSPFSPFFIFFILILSISRPRPKSTNKNTEPYYFLMFNLSAKQNLSYHILSHITFNNSHGSFFQFPP